MQSDIDFTTGGLRFYNADPPKTENLSDFVSEANINRLFDPIPSTYTPLYLAYLWRIASNLSSQWARKSSAPTR